MMTVEEIQALCKSLNGHSEIGKHPRLVVVKFHCIEELNKFLEHFDEEEEVMDESIRHNVAEPWIGCKFKRISKAIILGDELN